jgi:hypothetical protein
VPFSSADSGLFYFFNENNWEMLVKVVDGCAFNNHYWVFAAATTNIEYVLTVTDEETGAEDCDYERVPRTITALDADSITISPELAASPLRFTFVADWGNNDNLDLDLRLSSSSPDVGGAAVGATFDFPAFMRADFDSDGVRDVPALPF